MGIVPTWLKGTWMLSIILAVLSVTIMFMMFFTNRVIKPLFFKNCCEGFKNKPIIWMYWETLPGRTKPGYIDLCIDSVKFNCGNCFNVIVCNNKNIYKYLPEVGEMNFKGLKLPQKVDYYRYCLLKKYGGVWIDADTVVLKCMCPIYNKLKDYDYIGFGCGYSTKQCGKIKSGHNKPLNWMMMSRPNTKYMSCIKNTAKSRIQNKGVNQYHAIGKKVLSECIAEVKKEDPNWDYYHMPSKCQEYDSQGNKLSNIFDNFNIKDCGKSRYFFPLYNTAPRGFVGGYPKWFKRLTKSQLLKSDLPVTPVFMEAFRPKKKCY
tara:strand:- start:2 stop:955 length:954 start_codon:yes stop_codon:yes gene_type:complete